LGKVFAAAAASAKFGHGLFQPGGHVVRLAADCAKTSAGCGELVASSAIEAA